MMKIINNIYLKEDIVFSAVSVDNNHSNVVPLHIWSARLYSVSELAWCGAQTAGMSDVCFEYRVATVYRPGTPSRRPAQTLPGKNITQKVSFYSLLLRLIRFYLLVFGKLGKFLGSRKCIFFVHVHVSFPVE